MKSNYLIKQVKKSKGRLEGVQVPENVRSIHVHVGELTDLAAVRRALVVSSTADVTTAEHLADCVGGGVGGAVSERGAGRVGGGGRCMVRSSHARNVSFAVTVHTQALQRGQTSILNTCVRC